MATCQIYNDTIFLLKVIYQWKQNWSGIKFTKTGKFELRDVLCSDYSTESDFL